MTRLIMPTLFFLLLGTASVQASPTALLPGQFTQSAFEQHPGAQLPRDVRLRDDAGHAVTTASLFDGGRPLVLVFDYYRCTTLCGVVLGDLAAALAQTPLAPGKDYAVMAVSIDPGDSPADAAAQPRTRGAALERGAPTAGAGGGLVFGVFGGPI